jgi:hypothetical protein
MSRAEKEQGRSAGGSSRPRGRGGPAGSRSGSLEGSIASFPDAEATSVYTPHDFIIQGRLRSLLSQRYGISAFLVTEPCQKGLIPRVTKSPFAVGNKTSQANRNELAYIRCQKFQELGSGFVDKQQLLVF